MSATRDTSQKIGWCGDNLYRIYKGQTPVEQPKVTSFEPLKRNLEDLQRLHGELKQMIAELEKLVRE